MSFENWTIDELFARCTDYDDGSLSMDKEEFAALRRMLQGAEPVTTAYKLPFEQWLSQQTGTIDVECGCVMTEVFFHWLRVAYEAGNSPVIPDGLRLALSNAGIAAPESDEMLAATREKHIQELVIWVKDRKPFQSAPVAMKDHQVRELVNELRDIAVEYHGTQQLRERIARTVRAAMLHGGKS